MEGHTDSKVEDEVESRLEESVDCILEEITLYPVKSCGGMKALQWGITPRGLQYDRHWAIVSDEGKALTIT